MSKNEKWVVGDQFKLDGVKVKYVYTRDPDVKYDPCWKVTCVLDDEMKTELLAEGFNVRQDGDGDWILTAKRKVSLKGGKQQDPPTVVDAQKAPFNEIIGNGSTCNVILYGKYNNPKNEKPRQIDAKITVLAHPARPLAAR